MDIFKERHEPSRPCKNLTEEQITELKDNLRKLGEVAFQTWLRQRGQKRRNHELGTNDELV